MPLEFTAVQLCQALLRVPDDTDDNITADLAKVLGYKIWQISDSNIHLENLLEYSMNRYRGRAKQLAMFVSAHPSLFIIRKIDRQP